MNAGDHSWGVAPVDHIEEDDGSGTANTEADGDEPDSLDHRVLGLDQVPQSVYTAHGWTWT